MILFLDDDSNRAAVIYQRMTKEEKEKTIWCTTVEETIITLRDYKDSLELVMLDHDLGGQQYVNTKREDCGMEIVRWLEKQSRNPNEFEAFLNIKFVIHSWNTHAGPLMTERLQKIGLKATYKPFGM